MTSLLPQRNDSYARPATAAEEFPVSESDFADNTDLRRRSVRGASAVLVGQLLRFAISMVSQVYVARLLLPADFGLLAMIAPIVGFVALFSDFGLLQAVVQRPTVSQALLSTVFWFNMAISLGLALLFAVLTPVLVVIYAEPRIMAIGLVSSAMILVGGLGQLPGALLSRQLRFGVATIIEISSQLVGLVVAVEGAWHGFGYWSLVASATAAGCFATLATICVVRWRPSLPRRDADAIGMLRFGGQITGSRLVGYLNSSADNMMIGAVLGGVALGLYDRAWRLAALSLSQLCAPIDRLAMPVLSRLHDDPERYRRAFRQMIALLCLLVMPALLYGAIAADRLIPTVLGKQWTAAAPVFRWVCAGALISPLNNATFWLMLSQNRGADYLRYMTIASGINVAAYAAGLPFGLVSVAMSSALSVYILQMPILVLASTRAGPVDRRFFVHAVAPMVAVIAATAPVLYWLTHRLPPGSFVAIAIGGAATYALPAAILACFASGRATLGVAWNVLPGRVTRPVVRVWTRARPVQERQ